MAKRVLDPAQFARHYPPGTAEKCYEAALVIQRECEITTQIRTHRESMSSGTSTTSSTIDEALVLPPFFNGLQLNQPPSWADVGVEDQRHGRQGHHHQQNRMGRHYQQLQPPRHDQNFLMQQQPPAAPDVFSSMGHWQCEKPKGGRYNNGYHQQTRYQNFNQPPPPRGQDVFQDVGVWDSSSLLPKTQPKVEQKPMKIEPMPVDPYAPTPPPTFQPYPPMCSVSPSTSSLSSFEVPEEKNSWKAFEFLLNQKPSTSSFSTSNLN